jgi:hypothetical protein
MPELTADEAWAISRLQELTWMDKFPEERGHLLMIARAFNNIVGPVEENVVPSGADVDGNPLYTTYPGKSRDEMADMLLRNIAETCTRFPAPIVMRRIYECDGKYTPADGRYSAALSVGQGKGGAND